jgi:hypothetical protein
MTVRSIRGAATWLDGVGVASLLPGADLVLPSLWEAIAGTREVTWATERPDGKLTFTPEMDRCWRWKDELPGRGHALVGKHFGRWAALVAPRLISEVWTVAAERRESLTDVQLEIVDAVRGNGACTVPQLRALVPGAEKKHVEQLQRAIVLTSSHLVEQPQGWPAIAFDLVDELWDVHDAPEAEAELALAVLESSGEVSAADLGGALGWRVKRAREVLDALDLRVRVQDDVRLYSSV